MSTWIFEPGHTEAEFRARHMMVTWVRGLFKDIHGRLELEWDRCLDATFEGEVDLTLRGVTGTVPLDIVSLGEWKTPFWVGEENKGELLRILLDDLERTGAIAYYLPQDSA
jgi:polyisoprenoid-binding protein YceI